MSIVPDLVEPIVAYKILLFHKDLGEVSSIWHTTWPPNRVITAQCFIEGSGTECKTVPCPPQESGHLGDGCGIYGYKLSASFAGLKSRPIILFFEILLWGRVYEYELGYRSEFGKLNRLVVTDDAEINCHLLGFKCTDVERGLEHINSEERKTAETLGLETVNYTELVNQSS